MKKVFLLGLIAVVCSGCGVGTYGKGTNIKISQYHNIVQNNQPWNIDFSYQYGEVKEEISDSGKSKKTITRAYPQLWLQYLDGIFFELQGKYRLNIKKGISVKTGNIIKINPVLNPFQNFITSATITIHQDGKIVAKIDIVNEGKAALGRVVEPYSVNKLSQYSAEKIYKSISTK